MSQLRLGLGLVALCITAGYAIFQFGRGAYGTEVDLLIVVLGSILGSTLITEYVFPRYRATRYRYLLLPTIELLITYSLFGILTVAVFGGLAAAGVVSGLLVFCSFSAFMLAL
jgi:hypothetical protein